MAKVTEQQILDKIARVNYIVLPNSTVTICSIVMRNGFSVRGESACVDPEEFNEKLGREYAYRKAFDNVWQLEGYLLAEQLYTNRTIVDVHRNTLAVGSFGFALQALNDGKRVYRAGWNGLNQWLSKTGVDGGLLIDSDKFWSMHNREFAESCGGAATVMPCITLKNAQDQIVMGWEPSQGDLFATDWCILP